MRKHQNVRLLVALTRREHVLHTVAQRWFAGLDGGAWATSTITESGFLRASMNPRVSARPVSWVEALDMLATIRSTPGHQWWEEVDLMGMSLVRRAPVVGHGQVTDVHLAALAAHHGGRLATLDRGVAEALHSDDRGLVTVIPA